LFNSFNFLPFQFRRNKTFERIVVNDPCYGGNRKKEGTAFVLRHNFISILAALQDVLNWHLTKANCMCSSSSSLILGSEVLTALVRNSSAFWDITLCSSLSALCWFLLGLLFNLEDGDDRLLGKVG
jgi:hypothetical protein